MTSSGTYTQTWTITQARYVTAKIAADLDLLRTKYRQPTESKVSAFAEEAAILLAGKYLSSVEYGFEKNGKVVFALQYVAQTDGTLTLDERPGRIPSGLNLSGAKFYSFLRYSNSWFLLDEAVREKIKAGLPIQRSTGADPVTGTGVWEQNRSYSKNGQGVTRKVFKPI